MNTTKYTGRGELVNRLATQVGSRQLAIDILIRRGHMEMDGKTLTVMGESRNKMTAEERALDRESSKTGIEKSQLRYDSLTNRASQK